MEPRLTNQISSLYNIVTPARNEEDTIGEILGGVHEMTDDLIGVVDIPLIGPLSWPRNRVAGIFN
jgi:hypothetical protein